MCHNLPLCTQDEALLEVSCAFKGFSGRYHLHGPKICHSELNNAATVLTALLNSSSSGAIPAPVVYDVHSAIGLIYEAQGRYNMAIESFIKVFWIASGTNTLAEGERGLTLYRLGKVYALAGDYQMGKSLLERAIEIYETCASRKGTRAMADAKDALDTLYHVGAIFVDSRFPNPNNTVLSRLRRREGKVIRRRLCLADACSEQHAQVVELLTGRQSLCL